MEQEKKLILKNFLKAAAFDGWNENSLTKSADNNNTLLLFPNGIEDLTKYFHQLMNEEMAEKFSEIPACKIHEKIIKMIELKLSLYQPHKEAIRSLLKYNLKPQNILAAKSMLLDTCNKIWYLAGDKSTDYNYYTKRGLLAGVYSSSLVYWLADESEDHLNSKVFIRNRIQNVLTIGKWKSAGFELLGKLGRFLNIKSN